MENIRTNLQKDGGLGWPAWSGSPLLSMSQPMACPPPRKENTSLATMPHDLCIRDAYPSCIRAGSRRFSEDYRSNTTGVNLASHRPPTLRSVGACHSGSSIRTHVPRVVRGSHRIHSHDRWSFLCDGNPHAWPRWQRPARCGTSCSSTRFSRTISMRSAYRAIGCVASVDTDGRMLTGNDPPRDPGTGVNSSSTPSLERLD